MSALLLDTHIALWLANGDSLLRPSTLSLIDACYKRGGTIYLSAVSAWELALLVDRGHIHLDRPLPDWFEALLLRPGIAAVPLNFSAALAAYRLHPFAHRDPADRLLMATAIELTCPLVTYDRRILDFARRYGRQYRFSAAA